MSEEFDALEDVAQANAREELRAVLRAISKLDPSHPTPGLEANYDHRNVLVVQAVHLAMLAGIPAGFGMDVTEPLYVVAYIDLNEPGDDAGLYGFGQVSWHIPSHRFPFDGHTTVTKYERISQWTAL